MKRPYDYTIGEAMSLIGETKELLTVACQIHNRQIEIMQANSKELIAKIDKAKKDLAKPAKPETPFLSIKALLDASER